MPLNFGLARGVGAGSYALASTLCGSAAAAFGPKCIPVLLGGGDPPAAGGPPFPSGPVPQPSRRPHPSVPAIVSPVLLAALLPVPPLLARVVLLYTSHNILMSFPYQIVQYLGGGSGEMGTLLTLQGLMDIPAMVLFSLLLRRAASWRWVRLAGLSFFLHALLTWLAPSVLTSSMAFQIFGTTGYAHCTLCTTVYCWVNDATAPADRVQGRTCFTMANTLGIVAEQFFWAAFSWMPPAPDPPWPFPL
ncbi:MAG: hypothetical protein ACLT9P_09705 [Evtepia gabavorous]